MIAQELFVSSGYPVWQAFAEVLDCLVETRQPLGLWVLKDDAELGWQGWSQTVVFPIAISSDDEPRKLEAGIDYLRLCPSYRPLFFALLFVALDALIQLLIRPEPLDVTELVDSESGLGEGHLSFELAEGQNVG